MLMHVENYFINIYQREIYVYNVLIIIYIAIKMITLIYLFGRRLYLRKEY